MKTLLSIAAALAAIAFASVAFAHDTQRNCGSGRYEWQSRPTVGPRASLSAPERIWVSDAKQVASGDCAMMHETVMSENCMAMPHKSASTSLG